MALKQNYDRIILDYAVDQLYYQMQQDRQNNKSTNNKSLQESLHSDDSYEQSVEDEVEIPNKNPASQAIFIKYQNQQKAIMGPAIAEEDQDDFSQAEGGAFRFRIKNLDTGEEQEIENDEQQELFDKKLSEGRHKIENFEFNWKDFWVNVHKNNEQLRQYCETGEYDEARTMLQKGESNYPVQIDWKGLDDWSPIHYACYEGYEDIVNLLCHHNANINSVTKYNRNGLHIAALRGNLNVVKALVANKIDINAYDQDGNTALHFAAENGYKEIIEYLLDQGSKIRKNREGVTPIHDCCDQTLKKIFHNRGYKEDGNYEKFQNERVRATNRVQRQLITSGGLTFEDFVYHRLLGKGSFGQVFLVHRKGDESKKLYAMKVLSKDKVMNNKNNLQRYALTQRNVMSVLNHPFMVKLVYAFQSSSKLFLVMEYYPGGDLGKLISKKRSIPEDQARKYISELVLAFQALHKNMIVFRDLKPDNVVLDYEGHCRLTDFGLSKQGIYNNTTGSFCGSVAYLAPQILAKQGHSRTVDWYLLGLLLYELLVGLPPYYNSKKEVLFQNIKRGPLKIPKTMSNEAKDIIKKLLCRDPRKRLGASRDSQEIKEHQFFKGINWQDVFNRKFQMPPIDEPKINYNQTIKVNFDSGDTKSKIEGWTFINGNS